MYQALRKTMWKTGSLHASLPFYLYLFFFFSRFKKNDALFCIFCPYFSLVYHRQPYTLCLFPLTCTFFFFFAPRMHFLSRQRILVFFSFFLILVPRTTCHRADEVMSTTRHCVSRTQLLPVSRFAAERLTRELADTRECHPLFLMAHNAHCLLAGCPTIYVCVLRICR